jgi:hypothetical protein
MTFNELLTMPSNAPVRLADGKFGLLIRWWEPDQAGVQVPGEADIRTIPCARLQDAGNGALVEVAEPQPTAEMTITALRAALERLHFAVNEYFSYSPSRRESRHTSAIDEAMLVAFDALAGDRPPRREDENE